MQKKKCDRNLMAFKIQPALAEKKKLKIGCEKKFDAKNLKSDGTDLPPYVQPITQTSHILNLNS